jgi:hypothetical protein
MYYDRSRVGESGLFYFFFMLVIRTDVPHKNIGV